MSVPPGTEMFQFPGFASYAYGFSARYPFGWVAPFGYPRINACSRLPVAFRSVPRPSSPPGAKASTECPCYTRYPGLVREQTSLTMHRNHPQPHLGRAAKNSPGNTLLRTHNPAQTAAAAIARAIGTASIPGGLFLAPLNPRHPTVGAPIARSASRSDKSAEQRGRHPIRRRNSSHTRPETHQNLIYSNKQHTAPRGGQTTREPIQAIRPRRTPTPHSGHSAILELRRQPPVIRGPRHSSFGQPPGGNRRVATAGVATAGMTTAGVTTGNCRSKTAETAD